MKILVVDDSIQKVKKLLEVLLDSGVSRDAIFVVQTAMQARDRVRAETFDLVILDLLLPLREENEPSIQTSLSLLNDISERDDYLKPRRIVGFTAFDEMAMTANPLFNEMLWVVVVYSENSEAWKDSFRSTARYLLEQASHSEPLKYLTDVCIVAALPSPELEAIHRLPWEWQVPTPMDDSTFVRKGRFASGGRDHEVISASATRMGSVSAALLCAKLITEFRPRFLVMSGICAGVRGKTGIGDVILFEPAWEWPSGKLVSDDSGSYLEPAPHQIGVTEFLTARVEELGRDHVFLASTRAQWPKPPTNALRVIVAPGASGSAVVADSATVESIQEQHRKLTALDMEAYGVYAAARATCSPKPTAFAMKAVCDFADEKKTDDWQAYAAYTSAQAIKALFERNFASIRELAGT
jgi:nucleoside phosphorylase/CheY-like chemotaxis protein